MEDSQPGHRIRIFQYIQEAWRDSGKGRSLVDILADHTFGMTRDELEDFLRNSIVTKLELACMDLEASHAREEERSKDREARKKAEKASADKDAEIEVLKKALVDVYDNYKLLK